METVKTFVGITLCFALAFVVITAWPLISRLGNGINAGVQELDFAIGFAGYKRARERSGLDEELVDPAGSRLEDEINAHRKRQTMRAIAHENVGECERYKDETFCTSAVHYRGCRYDEEISLFWCIRD
ncbi:MAG: hypothetical protein ACR2QF_01275 [Geminicoccaceae bacterium]